MGLGRGRLRVRVGSVVTAGVTWVHHDLTRGCAVVRRAESRSRRERYAWVILRGATPHVSAASRARIVRALEETGKRARDVHATLRGTLGETGDGAPPIPPGARRVTYNPFRAAGFHYSDTGEPWTGGDVIVTGGYAYVI